MSVEQPGWADVPQLIAAIAPPTIPAQDYLIADFGAIADGQSDARPAIMQAMAQAAADGGGRIIIPPGRWFCQGPIHLKSHCELHLSAGAELYFSDNPADYLPAVLTHWEGTELFNYSPLIYAYMAEDVAISGSGTINGNAHNGFATWRDRQNPGKKRLRALGAAQTPVQQRIFGEGDFLRPSMVQFFGCTRVLVSGVTLIDSPFWVVHLVACNQAVVRGITVDSRRLNNDGVDIESSSQVLIEDNHFTTGDDSIVIKSGRDQDGWRLARAAQYVFIRRNFLQGHNGLAIGSEMSGGVRHVFMENNTLGEVRGALYFKGNPDRGGVIENVWLRHITVASSSNPLIQFRSNYQGREHGPYPPQFRRITIEDVNVDQVSKLLLLNGTAQCPIEDVTLARIHARISLLGGEELQASLLIDPEHCHLRRLSLHDVTVAGAALRLNAGQGD